MSVCNFQAFGVGALEEEDADIYCTDHLSNYDMTMDIGEKDSNFGWTAPGKHKPSKQLNKFVYISFYYRILISNLTEFNLKNADFICIIDNICLLNDAVNNTGLKSMVTRIPFSVFVIHSH